MRKATLINQDWLRSKTMALAGDTIENIAFRLLLISDDFGRFPYDPEGLRVMMNDIRHSPEMITEAINYLVDKGTLEKYESDGQVICCWLRWHDYQNIRWSDDAKYPDRDGTYEVSNNPQTIAKRADKRNVKRVVKRADRHNVQQSESEEQSEEESEEEKEPPDWCVSLVTELFPGLKKPKRLRQAETLEKLNRIDNYSQEEIELTLRWAKTDMGNGRWAGWSAQFLSCSPLRNVKCDSDASKFAKMKAAYEASKRVVDDFGPEVPEIV